MVATGPGGEGEHDIGCHRRARNPAYVQGRRSDSDRPGRADLDFQRQLPTAEEWAAEAGNAASREYPWGGDTASCDYAAWNSGNAGGCGAISTSTVCSKPRGNSVSGLCDMAGSVWEWTSTVHDGGYLLCGGSWLSKDPESHKASEHVWDSASSSSPANGFRCVRQAP